MCVRRQRPGFGRRQNDRRELSRRAPFGARPTRRLLQQNRPAADVRESPTSLEDKVPDLSRSVQVADTGTINLPLVGEVQASSKTAREIEQDLTKKLGDKYLQSPQVTVYVKEYNSRRVTIEGSVKKPGVYPIRDKSSLLQFISRAEGVTEATDLGNIVVFRTAEGKRSAAKFDLDEIRAGRAPDPEIKDGDVIVVNVSATKQAFQNLLKVLPVTSAFVPLL